MSALQSLLDKLSDHRQNKTTTPKRNASPNAFTKTEIEMAKTLCTLPSNGREERTDDGTEGGELIVKEEENKTTKSEGMEVDKLGEDAVDDAICCPIGRPISVLSSSSEKIFLNANFESFAEFDCAFEEWKSLYKHPFRVASSEKHKDPKFKYRYVVYHCSRYGEPRKRGQGRRPHQNYLPCGCSAKLRLNFHPQPGDGCLCVTTLNTEHNHEPMSECHSIWLKRRKSSPEEDPTGTTERSAEGGHDFESSTVSGEHSPISTASSSTALFSPLSLHAPQPHQLLHNSPSSSGGQSSSDSAGSSSSGGETAAVAALLMRTMPRSPLSETTGAGKTQRQTTAAGRCSSALFAERAAFGTHPPALSALLKHSLPGGASHPPPFASNQQNNSLLLSTLKAALMTNANGGGSKDGAQIGGGIGSAKKLAGEFLFRHQQMQRTADQRQTDQQQMQQQQQQQNWHIMPIIQELLRLEQQQNSLANGGGVNHQQNASQNHQTLSALLSQSLQRDQLQAKRDASPPPSATASPLCSSATALLSALRSINAPGPSPVPIPSSIGFFSSNQQPPSSPSSPSSSSALFQPPTVSPLVGLLQQAHLISSMGQPFGAGLSPSQTQPQNLNGTTAAYMAQQMQIGGEQQRREQQQQMAAENAVNAMNMGRAEIIREADLLLQTLVNQMIHSKDLVSYLARLRHFLTSNSP